ncbi:MAG: T9SS type A sorting domain-containing protein [Bacteroidota bacterium]|nr:T9SS type A sorting domain-containing protein [Bacteroidota bacterium]
MIKKSTLFLLTLLASFNLTSQTEYSFTHSSATYTDLTETTLINQVWDYDDFTISLPFKFKYFGVEYDTMYVGINSVYFTQSGADNIFMGSDNYIPQDDNSALSPISYVINGTTPNRILKVQYKNINAQLQDPQEEYSANYQMWFYETSSKFEFRFGPNVITDLNFTSFYYGFIDADNSPYLAISGTAANPSLIRVMNALAFAGIPTHPLNGQVYTFNPTTSPSTSLRSISNVNYTLGQSQNYFTLLSQSNAQLEIINSEGKSIKSIEIDKDKLITESTELLAKGVYILKISSNNQLFTEKLIVY